MLHIRDCNGVDIYGNDCKFPWCLPCKRMLQHLTRCQEPSKCTICNPFALPESFRRLQEMNRRRVYPKDYIVASTEVCTDISTSPLPVEQSVTTNCWTKFSYIHLRRACPPHTVTSCEHNLHNRAYGHFYTVNYLLNLPFHTNVMLVLPGRRILLSSSCRERLVYTPRCPRYF